MLADDNKLYMDNEIKDLFADKDTRKWPKFTIGETFSLHGAEFKIVKIRRRSIVVEPTDKRFEGPIPVDMARLACPEEK